jgi:hypothetical protein
MSVIDVGPYGYGLDVSHKPVRNREARIAAPYVA